MTVSYVNKCIAQRKAWTPPLLQRLGTMRDVADNRGGNNGGGRWNGNCNGKPCLS